MSNLVLIPIAACGSLLAAWVLGVFQPKAIIGPERLGPEESPRVLLGALGFAIAAWAICPLLFQATHEWLARRQHVAPTTQLSQPETVVFSGVMDLLILIGILAGTVFSRKGGIRRMGVDGWRIPWGVGVGVMGIAITLPLVLVANVITESELERLGKTHPAHQLLEVLKENPSPWLDAVDVLCAGLIAPVAEELFFRGVLQTVFRYVFKRSWVAIFMASALFALVHPWWTWPQIFLLAVCLGYAYERTGNLWVSITMHALFNLISIWMFTHLSG